MDGACTVLGGNMGDINRQKKLQMFNFALMGGRTYEEVKGLAQDR